ASVGLNDGIVRLHQNVGGTNGNQMFVTHIAVDLSPQEWLADIVAGDLDNDGWIDIATVEARTNRVVWYRNDGSPFTGVWTETQEVYDEDNSEVGNPAGISGVDMDGDGDLDLLVTFQAGGRVDWFENDGEGEFDDERNLVEN